ncbi:MAG: hypothetical protein LWW87_01825 [Geobacteraceae bacterium]|nr:hypothetical protein [Geobacteraceae bacterium]
MDRRTFLTNMLQGSLAAALLPNSISPLLIAQYASLHHPDDNSAQGLRISAIGIGSFGAYCTRLLAYSVHNIHCHEIAPHSQCYGCPEHPGLNRALQQCDLVFLLADTTQPSSSHQLSSCIDASAAAGVQVVIVGPHAIGIKNQPTTESPHCHCRAATPSIARDLVALVADLVNTDSFVGIDHADVKAILGSGSHGLLTSKQASGSESGTLACKQALEHLQQFGINAATCRGAIACIHGSPDMPFDVYNQAITALDSYFPADLSFVFGCLVDAQLGDSVKVDILAMQ